MSTDMSSVLDRDDRQLTQAFRQAETVWQNTSLKSQMHPLPVQRVRDTWMRGLNDTDDTDANHGVCPEDARIYQRLDLIVEIAGVTFGDSQWEESSRDRMIELAQLVLQQALFVAQRLGGAGASIQPLPGALACFEVLRGWALYGPDYKFDEVLASMARHLSQPFADPDQARQGRIALVGAYVCALGFIHLVCDRYRDIPKGVMDNLHKGVADRNDRSEYQSESTNLSGA